jgi:hypothetical protein
VTGEDHIQDHEDDEDDGDHLAEIIPLGVFDAREEAKKWW